MSLVKRLFVFALAVTTVLWSVGASLAPVQAAGNYGAGSLLALEGQDAAAVYYIGSDGMKYVFPDGKTYDTWYTNFDDVVRVDVAELDLYEDNGAVTYRAGTKLVTHENTAKIYALEPGGVLRWIPDAATAEALYGADWGAMVLDVIPGYFSSSYSTGTDLSDTFPDGTLVVMGTDYYYIDDGTKRIFASADAFEANNFSYDSALEVTDLDDYSDGESITGEETALSGYMPAEGGDTPVNAGSVSISLASDTPASGIGYEGATHVPFTKINFTAGADPVTIDSMVMERGGIPSSDAAFSGVNMLIDGTLHSSSYKSLNASHQATFTKDLVIPANTTVSALLVGKFVASLDAYSGEMPTLSIVEINTDASVSASLPITGNYQLLNHTITIGVLTVSENPDLGTLTEEVGTENVEFLNVKLANDSDQESLRIDSIRFNNAGSADDADVDNVELVVDGNIIATSAMDNNYVLFDLTDCGATCTIDDGQNETFQLRGDIVGGSGRIFDFDVKKADDIMGYDTSNQTYVTPSTAIDSGRTILISRGTLNVSKTNTVPSGNIPENTNDLELGSWNFKVAGEPITISSIRWDIDVTNGTLEAADFTNMKLVDADGTSLTGATDGVADTGAADGGATSTDAFTLPIGDNPIKLIGNLNDDATDGDTVQVAIDFSYAAGLDATGDVTGDAITVSTYAFPAAEVNANLLTVTDLALTVTTLPQPAAQIIAAGSSDHHYSTIRFDASDSSEDVKVTAFEFYIATDGATAKTNEIQNIVFEVDGTDLSITKDGSTATAGTDEEISVSLSGDDQFTITKGTAVNMKIYADLSAGATEAGTHKMDITSTNSNVVTSQGATSGNSIDAAEGTAVAKAMTVGAAGGTIEVSLDANNPNAALMAGGVEFALAKYKFLATTTEDVELDYLYLTQVVTETPSSSYEDYDEIWFVDELGTEVTGTRMTPTSTMPKINFANDAFVVPYADNNGVVLTLMAKLATIGGSGGGESDNAVGYKINAAADVVATGHLTGSGSTEYLSSGAAPTGNTHYYYRGYPVVTKDTLSNTLTNGINDLYKFTVTATNDEISLYGFTFGIATTGVTLSNFVLYSSTDGQDVSVTAGTADLNVWQTTGTDWSTNYSSDEVVIGSGTSHTFIMRATVASSGDSGDAVSVHLAGDAAHVAGTDTLLHTASEVDDDANGDFIWSDRSAGAHTASTDDWTNGFLVSGVTSPSGTSETTGL